MQIVKQIERMRKIASDLRKKGTTIGFVPTLGALHEGHLSLIRKSVEMADQTIISIFVNRLQFDQEEDFKQYPQDITRDADLAKSEGVSYIFRPSSDQMYPSPFRTSVDVEEVTEAMCGRQRPEHFRGVATGCLKLFQIIHPHMTFFGQKDPQQAVLVRQMMRDLNLDIEMVLLPIVRMNDGLAYSSRNQYLSEDERSLAPILYQSLLTGKRLIEEGERNSEAVEEQIRVILQAKPSAVIDYVAIVDAGTLQEIDKLEGRVLMALAVQISKARLIDNMVLQIDRSKMRELPTLF